MDALKLAVEEIVAPIPAEGTLKNTYRRELYAHLSDLHAEELARTGDTSSAIHAALGRLGEPEALRMEFLASQSRLSRFFGRINFASERKPQESTAKYVARVFAWAGIPYLVGVYGVMMPLAVLFKGENQAAGMLAGVAVFGFIQGFAGWTFLVLTGQLRVYATTALRISGSRKEVWIRVTANGIVATAILWGATYGGLLMGHTLLAAAYGPDSAAPVFLSQMKTDFALLFCVAMSVALFIVSAAFAFERRFNGYIENWPYQAE